MAWLRAAAAWAAFLWGVCGGVQELGTFHACMLTGLGIQGNVPTPLHVCTRERQRLQAAARSFSLVYTAEKEGTPRTLDLTCQTHQDFELWFCGLQVHPLQKAAMGC